ncbi:G2/M phase-specific E3 ubiquitin-protein ligase-like [Clytia hemisphaerica]|uniref:G2/M phase-specific E3 ubiquitin-protein ligase-like n=1 Tax=Clytia hemisphaerica TaxID=252671 RepID=UPI0034D7AF67
MNRECFKWLCDEPIDPTHEFLDLPSVKPIADAGSEEELALAFQNDATFDLLIKIGHQGLPPKLEKKDEFLRMLYYKETLEPRIEAIRQFQAGLNMRGLLPLIKKHSEEFSKFFVFNAISIDYFQFVDEFKPIFQPEGSNKFIREEPIYKYFCDYIESCNSSDNATHSLSDVCQFITGSMNIPPMGFQPKIVVKFVHDCDHDYQCYPEASTCAYVIKLPVHINSLQEMITKMDETIINAPFFFKG